MPVGRVGHRHSRFDARPRGSVIAWCLDLDEVLETEDRRGVDGVVVVRAYDRHAPWITAYAAEHLGGEVVPAVTAASAAIKAMAKRLSMLPALNQGLTDSRERSAAAQALTQFRQHGHNLDVPQLITEALGNDCPRDSPLELGRIASQISSGKRLRSSRG